MADTDGRGWRKQGDVEEASGDARTGQSRDGGEDASGAASIGCIWSTSAEAERANIVERWSGVERSCGDELGLARSARLPLGPGTLAEWAHAATTGDGWWATEPDVGRVVVGTAARVDRRKRLIALGNSLVPDILEIIGRAIMKADAATTYDGAHGHDDLNKSWNE